MDVDNWNTQEMNVAINPTLVRRINANYLLFSCGSLSFVVILVTKEIEQKV